MQIGVPAQVSPGAETPGLGFFEVAVEGLLVLLDVGPRFVNLCDDLGWSFELEPGGRNLIYRLCLQRILTGQEIGPPVGLKLEPDAESVETWMSCTIDGWEAISGWNFFTLGWLLDSKHKL